MKIVNKMAIFIGALLMSMSACYAADAAISTSTIPTIKVAVVNVQQVLQQSPRVAELSKKLETQFKDRQAKIAEEQKALQDQAERLKKDAPTMSQKDRDALQKKIANDRANLVKQVVAYQQDLQKEQNKIMQGILSNLNGIVSTMAKNQGYSLVLDSQAVIFAADGNDITKDVSKQFNTKS